jgi:hypothetical protein
MNELKQSAIICCLGATIAWCLTLPLNTEFVTHLIGRPLADMITFGIVGSALAVCITATEGLLARSLSRATQYAKEAAIIGFAWGGLGVLVGDAIFDATTDLRGRYAILLWLFRAIGWCAAGASAGFASGVADELFVRILRGLIGGAIGGAIGGLLFDPICYIFGAGAMSRLVGFIVLGLCVGLLVRLAATLTRRAWLVILEGKGKGREIVLDLPEVTLGKNELVEVLLLGANDVAGRHARLTRNADGAWLEELEGTIEVDGHRGRRLPVKNGSTITLGSVKLAFVQPGAAVAEPAPPVASVVQTAPSQAQDQRVVPQDKARTVQEPAPVTPPPQPAIRGWGVLECRVHGRPASEPQGRFDLEVDELMIGSDATCTYRLTDSSVAPRHVLLKRAGGQIFIFDKSGGLITQVNGQTVQGRTEIKAGSEIRIGDWVLLLKLA